MRYALAEDYAEATHVVSTNVDKTGMCGREVGLPTYTGDAHAHQLVRLLIELPHGCQKCADLLMGSKHMKAGQDSRYAKQHTKETRT